MTKDSDKPSFCNCLAEWLADYLHNEYQEELEAQTNTYINTYKVQQGRATG